MNEKCKWNKGEINLFVADHKEEKCVRCETPYWLNYPIMMKTDWCNKDCKYYTAEETTNV